MSKGFKKMNDVIMIFFRLLSKFKRLNSVAAAKKAGLRIGAKTILVGDQSFGTEPFLIEIGANCLITDGVKFITHDGSIQVPLIAAGEKLENVYSKKSIFGRIKIGNNVFVGVSSIILPGTVIGDNSIIGAGSIVKGVFPSGVVLAGQPAKIIDNIRDYHGRKANQILRFNDDDGRENQVVQHLIGLGK